MAAKRKGTRARKATRKSTRAVAAVKAPVAKRAKGPIALPEGWTVDKDGKSVSIRLKTKDFLEALLVINEVGQVAEDLQHHPDFHLERWNRLRITTYSHDVGKLTERDERLAERVSELLAKRGLKAVAGK
jgi:4a-hydroxytetrahydrobiopterin dehydratase